MARRLSQTTRTLNCASRTSGFDPSIYPSSRRQEILNDHIGISLPGTPAIAIGSNRLIAWGFTNSYGDFTDWVRVRLDSADSMRYRSAEGWKSLVVHREILHVRGER